jgi:hypothetical protein
VAAAKPSPEQRQIKLRIKALKQKEIVRKASIAALSLQELAFS